DRAEVCEVRPGLRVHIWKIGQYIIYSAVEVLIQRCQVLVSECQRRLAVAQRVHLVIAPAFGISHIDHGYQALERASLPQAALSLVQSDQWLDGAPTATHLQVGHAKHRLSGIVIEAIGDGDVDAGHEQAHGCTLSELLSELRSANPLQNLLERFA